MVTLHLPRYLASFTGQQNPVVLEDSPATVGQALDMLWSRYPALRDRMVDEQRRLRPQLNVFVAHDSIRRNGGFAKVLPPDAQISVLPSAGIDNG